MAKYLHIFSYSVLLYSFENYLNSSIGRKFESKNFYFLFIFVNNNKLKSDIHNVIYHFYLGNSKIL